MAVYVCRRCEYSADAPWEDLCPRCRGPYRWRVFGADTAEQKGRITFGSKILVRRECVPTGLEGFDRVLSGGLTPGNVLLVGGYPGAGKTTLMALVANSVAETQKRVAVYASGEQSAEAVHERAAALGLSSERVEVLGNQQSIEKVLEFAKSTSAFLLIADSAQKFASIEAGGAPGSSSQLKAVADVIARHCQATKTCAIVVNQVSKDGELKGGTEFEHNCDAVAVLGPPHENDEEAPRSRKVRALVILKNRVGDENLKSYWMMHGQDDPKPGMLECVPPRPLVEISSRRRRRG